MITRSTFDSYLKIFIACGLSFGLCLGLMFGVRSGIAQGVFAGVGGGLVFGLLMSLILGAIQQFTTKQLKTGYEENLMGVHQVQVFEVHKTFDDTFKACVESLLALPKCKIVDQDNVSGFIHARTGATWKSFGEKLMITVSPLETASCRVTLSSKPALDTTLVDYGKNVENLRIIVGALEQRAAITPISSAGQLPSSDSVS